MATLLDANIMELIAPIIIFLFIMLVSFAVMDKFKLMGENKALHALVAFCLGVLFLFSRTAVGVVVAATPWFIVMIVLGMFVISFFLFLGVKEEKLGAQRGGYYSQGVGAAQLAKNYGLSGKKKLALRWAKKSEQVWLKFFKLDPNWYNSYFFYAMSLAYQNRLKDCDKAFEKAARIAKKPKNWKAIRKEKKEIMKVHQAIYGGSKK